MNYPGETLFRRKNPEAAGFFIALKNKISGSYFPVYQKGAVAERKIL